MINKEEKQEYQTTGNIKIEKFGVKDLEEYINMTKEFYASGATVTEFDLEVTKRNFKQIIKEDDFLNGFFITKDNMIAGFIILSFMWSSEVGGKTVFLEELFIKNEFRKQGLATYILNLVIQKFKNKVSRFRLEVCKTNIKALDLYRQLGFECLDYQQMILDKF